jgi:hypothetical protein
MSMKTKPKTELMLSYVGALGLSAIKVMVGKTGESLSLLVLEAEPALTEQGGPEAFETLWFAKANHAELVMMNCLDDLGAVGAERDGIIDLPASTVRDYVVNIAAGLGAEWRTTAQIVESAGEAIEEIEKNVEALNKSGALRPLNARYKAYRFAMMAAGEAAINYSAYLQVFKLRVAKLIGQNVAIGAGRYQGFSEIIPSLVVEMDGAVRGLPALRNTMAPRAEKLSDTPSGMTTRRSNKMRMLKV